VQHASSRRAPVGFRRARRKKQVQAAHGAQGTQQDGAVAKLWRQDRRQSSAAQPVLDLGDTSRRRVALSPIGLNSFVFAAASRSSRHLLLCACVRVASCGAPLQEFCLILLELARAPRHAWTPACAGGRQRVARALSPAQRSAAAMTMDGSIFFIFFIFFEK